MSDGDRGCALFIPYLNTHWFPPPQPPYHSRSASVQTTAAEGERHRLDMVHLGAAEGGGGQNSPRRGADNSGAQLGRNGAAPERCPSGARATHNKRSACPILRDSESAHNPQKRGPGVPFARTCARKDCLSPVSPCESVGKEAPKQEARHWLYPRRRYGSATSLARSPERRNGGATLLSCAHRAIPLKSGQHTAGGHAADHAHAPTAHEGGEGAP